MAEADQTAESKQEAKSIWVVVGCVFVILVGMAWYLTFDWPSGKHPDVDDFILFWFRELLVLGALLIVACVWAVRKLLGSDRGISQK